MKEIFGVTICVFVLALGLMYGMSRQELYECNQWKEQAKQFTGFYLVEWQEEQCEHAGVEVGAKIINNKN